MNMKLSLPTRIVSTVKNKLQSKNNRQDVNQLELEENSVKSRTGIYLLNDVVYLRKKTLEGVDSQLVVIDIEGKCDVRKIINDYRCFDPQEGITPREKLKKKQLRLIENAMVPKTILLCDFWRTDHFIQCSIITLFLLSQF